MKNIILCSDGTGNSAIKGRGTNVFKLYEALDRTGSPCHTPQLAFYDDGVGTRGFRLFRILGGAFGLGLARNVRGLYLNLVRTYDEGDRIYLFGFSRGAFTVRVLAGMIYACGIVSRNHEDGRRLKERELRRAVVAAHKVSRSEYRTALNWIGGLLRRRQARRSEGEDIPIQMIGVWDTVDAVGLPFKDMADALNWIFHFKLPDVELPSNVERAFHALAIDDERATFHPVLWDETKKDPKQILEQVWFAGVHANVGGGYPKQGMSLVSLTWMMKKAKACGLRFTASAWQRVKDSQNVHDHLYDSRSGVGGLYRYKPREIEQLCKGKADVRIHESVVDRIRSWTGSYAPATLRPVSSVGSDGSRCRDGGVEIVPTLDAVRTANVEFWNTRHFTPPRTKGWRLLRWLSHFALLNFLILSGLVVARIQIDVAPNGDPWQQLLREWWWMFVIFWLWLVYHKFFLGDRPRTTLNFRVPHTIYMILFPLSVLVLLRDYFLGPSGTDLDTLRKLGEAVRDVVTSYAGRLITGVGAVSFVLYAVALCRSESAGSWDKFRTAANVPWRVALGLLVLGGLWIGFGGDRALLKSAERLVIEIGPCWWVVAVGYVGASVCRIPGRALLAAAGGIALFSVGPQVVSWLGCDGVSSAASLVGEIVQSGSVAFKSYIGLGFILIAVGACVISGFARQRIREISADAWRVTPEPANDFETLSD